MPRVLLVWIVTKFLSQTAIVFRQTIKPFLSTECSVLEPCYLGWIQFISENNAVNEVQGRISIIWYDSKVIASFLSFLFNGTHEFHSKSSLSCVAEGTGPWIHIIFDLCVTSPNSYARHALPPSLWLEYAVEKGRGSLMTQCMPSVVIPIIIPSSSCQLGSIFNLQSSAILAVMYLQKAQIFFTGKLKFICSSFSLS